VKERASEEVDENVMQTDRKQKEKLLAYEQAYEVVGFEAKGCSMLHREDETDEDYHRTNLEVLRHLKEAEKRLLFNDAEEDNDNDNKYICYVIISVKHGTSIS